MVPGGFILTHTDTHILTVAHMINNFRGCRSHMEQREPSLAVFQVESLHPTSVAPLVRT